MAVAEQRFLLDTGAWVAVRRQRLRERAALWGITLGVIAALVVVAAVGTIAARSVAYATSLPTIVTEQISGLGTEKAKPEAPPVTPPPPATGTSVAVWNGLGAQGVAAETARRLTLEDYPIATVGDAPTRGYERTYVMYKPTDPEGEAAAKQVISTLGLKHAVAQPMDGVTDDEIQGARLLVIIADPLRD
jgi:hypothetical protein